MRQKSNTVITALLLAVMLTACGGRGQDNLSGWEPIPDEAATEAVSAAGGDTETDTPPSAAITGESVQEAATDSLTQEEAENDDTLSQASALYCWGLLSEDKERAIYGSIYTALTDRREVTLQTLDKDEIDRLYGYVMADHPEIFYVSGYTYTTHTVGGILNSISFAGNYTYPREEAQEMQEQIDVAVEECLAAAPRDGDDYAKIRYVYDWVVKNTEYDLSAPDNQNIISVFCSHRSVCNGYAKAVQYLLNRLGVECVLVGGTTRGESHAWDLVLSDGAWYYVDATWGDSSFTGGGSEGKEWVNYDYLNVTTADILTNHEIDDDVPMPECTASADNYYVRSGCLFDSWDSDRFQQIVNNAYDTEEKIIRVRASSEEVYNEMCSVLIDQQGIYDFLRGEDTISYTKNDELRTLMIIL